MASTPSGKDISWLYSLRVVRLRRQALCRLEVQGLLLGATGEPNVSKLNWELFMEEAVVGSAAVSSVGTYTGIGNVMFIFATSFERLVLLSKHPPMVTGRAARWRCHIWRSERPVGVNSTTTRKKRAEKAGSLEAAGKHIESQRQYKWSVLW